MTHLPVRRILPAAVLMAVSLACGSVCRADRAILSPSGMIVPPSAVKVEYALRASDSSDNLGWLHLGLPQEDLGVELEAQRTQFGGISRTGFSAQYSLTGNVMMGTPAPVLSVGVRDALRSGTEGRAFYAVATKSISLPATELILSDLRVSVGYGSNGLGGGFASAEAKFRPGLIATVEYLNRRLNAQVALPLARIAQLRAYSLDGTVYYGAVVTLRK